MTLELTQTEADLTLHILQGRLGELRQEIHHSTVSTFTDQLKATETQLKTIIHKLDLASSQNGGP